MQLAMRDAAGILKVSEKDVLRWIKQGLLPAHRVNEQYRLNKADLLEFATSRKIPFSPELFAGPASAGAALPTLSAAPRTGGVHYGVPGNDKPAVLREVVERLHLPDDVDRQFLLQVLLARESLGSTGVGDGLAIPHVRNPIVLHIHEPMIALCFLQTPIDFAAIDRKPVHVLFTMVSPTINAHLHLLSQLAFTLRDEPFKQAVLRQAPADEIFTQAARVEQEAEERHGALQKRENDADRFEQECRHSESSPCN